MIVVTLTTTLNNNCCYKGIITSHDDSVPLHGTSSQTIRRTDRYLERCRLYSVCVPHNTSSHGRLPLSTHALNISVGQPAKIGFHQPLPICLCHSDTANALSSNGFTVKFHLLVYIKLFDPDQWPGPNSKNMLPAFFFKYFSDKKIIFFVANFSIIFPNKISTKFNSNSAHTLTVRCSHPPSIMHVTNLLRNTFPALMHHSQHLPNQTPHTPFSCSPALLSCSPVLRCCFVGSFPLSLRRLEQISLIINLDRF